MKRHSILVHCLLLSIYSMAQIDSISQRVFLIGDAGELVGNTHPVIDWLQKNVNWDDEKNTAVFLGDNIYPLGLPAEGETSYPTAKKIIDYQISLVKGKKARAFFIPGNHDWVNGKMSGWQQVMNEENYINSLEQKNIIADPRDGCPGPVAYDLNEKVVLVLMDSQWFLHIHDKPGPSSNCVAKTVDEFTTELREIVANHQNQLLIMAMHHPIYSHGVHGGDYRWKEHIFPLTAINPKLYIPLPVLGSVYPIARGVFGNLQDVNHPLYRTMANSVNDVLKEHPNPIAVAGHDHSLQMIIRDSLPYVVSGSGSNLSRVKQSNRQGKLVFSDLNYGFAVIEVFKSGKADVKFYNIQSPDFAHPRFVQELKKIDTLPQKISPDSIPDLPAYVTAVADSTIKINGARNFLIGKNYRREWTAQVRVPVLDLGKEMGGLTPEKQGGGKQTKSLRLEDKNGKEWALRSIEKFPEAAIPPELRTPFAKDVVADAISASYPFASLSIAPLASAAGVPPIRRKLVYIPDDPRLGRFRSTFKNTFAVLEERQPVGVKNADNTDELVLRLAKDNDDHVDQVAVLNARLLDNFIMDFDRHEDQWQWATKDTGKGKLFYPIPRDHDQAFFINEGIIPRWLRKPWLVPEIQGFKKRASNIKTFNKPARNFDRFFLNAIDESTWRTQVETFISKMTDDVIDSSLRRQPKEIQGFRAKEIAGTLKEKRKYFMRDMMEYYRFISKQVNIVGSNQRELFVIDKKSDGKIDVTVNKINKDNEITSLMYHRLFDPQVTEELRIYGLEDRDSFVVKGSTSPIKIRIVGGPGNDHFVTESEGGKTLIYDVSFEQNQFSENGNGVRKIIKADPQNNSYNRLFYKYNFVNPGLAAGYNIDDGLFLGYQLEVHKQGFRKDPYASRHFIKAVKAVGTASYNFIYEGDLIKAVGNSDLLFRANVKAPINVTNFFGLGNETVFDKTKPGKIQYYRARYDMADFSALLRRQLQSWMRITYGAAFQYLELERDQNQGKFVTNAPANGLNPATLYDSKVFAGAQAGLDINSKNSPAMPTRGFVLDAGLRSLFGLNGNSNTVTQAHWDMRLFASFKTKATLVYAFRLGAGRTFGDFEFPQAQYLGGTENLRGYRKDRFAGRTMVYNNSEIRWKVADFKTYLFPGSFGIFVFNDVGRIWQDEESSTDWHVGNGAGIWLSPLRKIVVTAAWTRSKEEKALPLVTLGFQF